MFSIDALLLFTLLFALTLSQDFVSNCRTKETCSECIQELGCVWCINAIQQSHCFHQNESSVKQCKSDLLVNPKSSFEVKEEQPLSNSREKTVQISPQKIQLSLRKEEERDIHFQYEQAKDYPVDLYYIMDLSASMKQHKEKLAKLGSLLAQTMINLTHDFRLGFGSFVDKVELPFASTAPKKLKKPCEGCVAPYSFKNHMKLSANYEKFSDEVSNAQVSGNLDIPEGGFDALMQAIICKNVVGWRPQARHLIVFSTDAEFHIAGDGKLAGVVEPNDALCHMEGNNYTHDLILDYPSISQINHVARENNINLIFAIVDKPTVVLSYKTLSENIENSNMGTLDDKSDNVIQLVLDNYNKIVNSVTISTNSSSDVEIKISSTCKHRKLNGCTDIHAGERINFTATIKPLACTKDSSRKTIYIKPEGLNETVIVDLEILCDCDCEFPNSSFHISNSPQCSKSGTLKCGICDCNPGFFGQICECNKQTSSSIDDSNCKPNKNDTMVCSGLGICKCGQCRCVDRPNPEEKIFGKFCQCDNYSCKRVGGQLCSQRGTCHCGGFCRCEAGWSGDACQCSGDTSSCIKPDNNNLICNGHGECKCGKCECFNEKVRYSGKYCDECPTCSAQRCKELRDCVECQVHKSGTYNEQECQTNCTTFDTETEEKIENVEDERIKTCTIVDNEGCTFVFQYEYDLNKQLIVKAEKKKFCPSPPDVLAWVLGVIGSILLAGLIILIIWKIFTTIHDRREYARFENERKKVQWHSNENPHYIPATSTFANPVYNRSSKS